MGANDLCDYSQAWPHEGSDKLWCEQIDVGEVPEICISVLKVLKP